uniref:FMRFamide-18 n=1 Tax=Lucilia cuprina TaxID=7375 RepID=FAR18_LUCCU|nr:RecName: Full=FMRFamide-18; AltName: Full=LucFMRFamide-18 [Lucilia cuprina]
TPPQPADNFIRF